MIAYSNSLINFLKRFGDQLKNKLQLAGGNINNVEPFDLGNIHPVFNGMYNKFHGLQILINYTDYTEIQLEDFHIDANGKRIAFVTVTIHDHFGLDKMML